MPALAGAGDALQPAAEREVDQLDVMHGDVRAGIAAADPLGELAAADALGLQQRAVAVVDVLQLAVGDQRAQLLVVGIEQLVIDDLGQHVLLPGQLARARRARPATAPTAFRSARACRPASAALAAAKCRSSGVATQTKSTPCFEQLADRVRLVEARELGDLLARRLAIGLGPAAGAAGDGGQLDLAHAERADRRRRPRAPARRTADRSRQRSSPCRPCRHGALCDLSAISEFSYIGQVGYDIGYNSDNLTQ